MKKSILGLAIAISTLSMQVLPVWAADDATVSFTKDNKLEYSNVAVEEGSINFGAAFEGVAPGETRSQTIIIQNNNEKTIDFYMRTEVLEALESSRTTAKGAGYDIKLTAGDVTLYDSVLGGYTAANEEAASTVGLKGMNRALKDYILIATLKSGESADVVLNITFDGEAMDNIAAIDYSRTTGQIAFDFKAGYEDPTGITTEYKIVTEKGEDRYITNLAVVQTGDEAMLVTGAAVLMAGVVLVVIGRRKRVGESS